VLNFTILYSSICDRSRSYRMREDTTCSTVVLQCYRRQAIPMEQAKIWPFVTLYSLDRSSPNLVWLITSATPTQMPVLA